MLPDPVGLRYIGVLGSGSTFVNIHESGRKKLAMDPPVNDKVIGSHINLNLLIMLQ